MARIKKTADELRGIILEEATKHPVCPDDIDVNVRPDTEYRWKADTIFPGHSGSADCVHHIGRIVARLRADYDLEGQ